MSRALYHLSYGTSCAGVRLTSRLRSCLELALLDSVLGDRDALPLVHPKHSLIRTKPGCPRLRGCCNWLRRLDSNQRPSGYEPDELPLLHSAIGLYRRSGIRPGPPGQCFGVGVGLAGGLAEGVGDGLGGVVTRNVRSFGFEHPFSRGSSSFAAPEVIA